MKRYRERMHTASVAGHHSRGEKKERVSRDYWRTIRLFLNKTTFELGILGVICGAVLTIISHHPYFQITDVKIDGLDSYATEIAKRAVAETQNISIVKIPTNNYIFFREKLLLQLLDERIAIDNILLTKRFPHTITIHAVERQTAFIVEGKNGTAYIANDGTLVRWYERGINDSHDQSNLIQLHLPRDIFDTQLHQQVIDKSIIDRLNVIAGFAPLLHRGVLESIALESELETIELRFSTKVVVLARLDADIDVQMQKAKLSSVKFPNAKKIDVRFADKVFVTF